MSSIIWSYYDEDASPAVYSNPPHEDEDGDIQPAQVVLHPWGPDPMKELKRLQWSPEDGTPPPAPPVREKSRTVMYLSIDEAEELARKLIEVVLAAKDGVYSVFGHHMAEYSREQNLRDAWKALGLDTDNQT
jgi:hypothetical protein